MSKEVENGRVFNALGDEWVVVLMDSYRFDVAWTDLPSLPDVNKTHTDAEVQINIRGMCCVEVGLHERRGEEKRADSVARSEKAVEVFRGHRVHSMDAADEVGEASVRWECCRVRPYNHSIRMRIRLVDSPHDREAELLLLVNVTQLLAPLCKNLSADIAVFEH